MVRNVRVHYRGDKRGVLSQHTRYKKIHRQRGEKNRECIDDFYRRDEIETDEMKCLTEKKRQRREDEPERIAVPENHVRCPTRKPRAVADRRVEHLQKVNRV